MADAGGREAELSQLAADLATHAGFGDKISGSAGDLATADWIAGRLSGCGYEVAERSFPLPVFETEQAELSASGTTAPVRPQERVVATGEHGLTAPLALIHHEAEAGRARNAIALLVTPFGRHASLSQPPIGPMVRAATDAGARGIVVVTTGPSGEAVALNASPDAPFVPVPMAILAPKDAEPFIAAAARGEPATLTLTGTEEERESVNLTATLARGERWLAFSTPRTGWVQSAGERGTGTAAFLALADWAAARFPELSVFALNSGGHEWRFAGTHLAFEDAPPPDRTLVWTHLGAALAAKDMHEWRGEPLLLPSADPHRIVMGTAGLQPVLTEAFHGLTGLERPMPALEGAGELSTIIGHGYDPAFAVLGVHSWFHTVEDTLDKVDAGLLLPVVDAHKAVIETVVAQSG